MTSELWRNVGEIKFVLKVAGRIIFLYNFQRFDISEDVAERIGLKDFEVCYRTNVFLLNISNKYNK